MAWDGSKRCVYTVITGGYDTLKEPEFVSAGFDYICFTDDPTLTSSTWQFRIVEKSDKPQLQQRRIKILAHEYLPEYDLTIYIDGSTVQVKDFNGLLPVFTGGIMMKQHARRRCIYEEIAACLRLKKDDDGVLRAQLAEYEAARIPRHLGMGESGFLVRDKSAKTIRFCNAWFEELRTRSIRDQISMPVVSYRLGIPINYRPYNDMQQYIRIMPHVVPQEVVKVKPASVRIWYIQPFASDLNIGKEYNEQISLLPENDWICILDQDVTFLYPKTKQQIQDIVNRNRDYALFGCLVSRLGSGTQCYNGERSTNHDSLYHYDIAERLHKEQYGVIRPHKGGIAGCFMLFPKSTWERVKFVENSPYFDTSFSREVVKWGKVGILEGVYLQHFYRGWASDPKNDKQHLLT